MLLHRENDPLYSNETFLPNIAQQLMPTDSQLLTLRDGQEFFSAYVINKGGTYIRVRTAQEQYIFE